MFWSSISEHKSFILFNLIIMSKLCMPKLMSTMVESKLLSHNPICLASVNLSWISFQMANLIDISSLNWSISLGKADALTVKCLSYIDSKSYWYENYWLMTEIKLMKIMRRSMPMLSRTIMISDKMLLGISFSVPSSLIELISHENYIWNIDFFLDFMFSAMILLQDGSKFLMSKLILHLL